MVIRVEVQQRNAPHLTEYATIAAEHITAVSGGRIIVAHGAAYVLACMEDEDIVAEALARYRGGVVDIEAIGMGEG